MSYLRGLRTVLRLALEVSVLVSVLWQGQGQGTDQGSKNLPRDSLEPRHCLEAPHHWQYLPVQLWRVKTSSVPLSRCLT